MKQMRLFRFRLTAQDVLNVFTSDDEFLSRAEIAQRLGMSKGKTVISVIEQCVEDGLLERHNDALTNGTPIFLYKRA